MTLWKEKDIRVIPVIASVAMAKRMEKCGADAVVAEGYESGGHVGESTTMTLVPQVCDAVRIPVIAAGGIADRRQFMAAPSGTVPEPVRTPRAGRRIARIQKYHSAHSDSVRLA